MSNTFSLTDYERMIKQISERQPLIVNKIIDDHKIHLYSSAAACNWSDGTKKGNYIICCDFCVQYGNSAGHGSADRADKFLGAFDTYEKFIDYVNYMFAERLKASKFKKLPYEYTQLSMF